MGGATFLGASPGGEPVLMGALPTASAFGLPPPPGMVGWGHQGGGAGGPGQGGFGAGFMGLGVGATNYASAVPEAGSAAEGVRALTQENAARLCMRRSLDHTSKSEGSARRRGRHRVYPKARACMPSI